MRKNQWNKNSAYLRRLLNCDSIAPVDPATNTDGIVIPCLSKINDNDSSLLKITKYTNYSASTLFYCTKIKCDFKKEGLLESVFTYSMTGKINLLVTVKWVKTLGLNEVYMYADPDSDLNGSQEDATASVVLGRSAVQLRNR